VGRKKQTNKVIEGVRSEKKTKSHGGNVKIECKVRKKKSFNNWKFKPCCRMKRNKMRAFVMKT
jgi:hypothetical protein